MAKQRESWVLLGDLEARISTAWKDQDPGGVGECSLTLRTTRCMPSVTHERSFPEMKMLRPVMDLLPHLRWHSQVDVIKRHLGTSLVLMVKNLPASAGDRHGFDPLGGEGTLEEGMATHSSILAWRIPRTEEPGRLQSAGSQRVRRD